VLQAIRPRLVPGSTLLLIHLTRPDLRGDAQAFLEVFGNRGYTLAKSPIYPSFSIARIQ
jgi:hypothetical protein